MQLEERKFEDFSFNIYITASIKTEEQQKRMQEVSDSIVGLFDKLKGSKLSGYAPGLDVNMDEYIKRLDESDVIIVISDEIDSDSIFQIGYALKLGIPIVVFTESPSTKIGAFTQHACSCFVNTFNDISLLEIFLTQAYNAKHDTYTDMIHISGLEDDLNKEIQLHKEQEDKITKSHNEQVLIYKSKSDMIEKGSREAFEKATVRIKELGKYKGQTSFIGTIE